MENRIRIDNKLEELKEREEEYYLSLNLDGFDNLKYPSLKYAIFNMKISREFENKITIIKKTI